MLSAPFRLLRIPVKPLAVCPLQQGSASNAPRSAADAAEKPSSLCSTRAHFQHTLRAPFCCSSVMLSSQCILLSVLLFASVVVAKKESSWSSPVETFYKVQWKHDRFVITVEGQFRQYGAVVVAKRKLDAMKESWCTLAYAINEDKRFSYQKYWTADERKNFLEIGNSDGCFESPEKKGYFNINSGESGTINDETDERDLQANGILWQIIVVFVVGVAIMLSVIGAVIGCSVAKNAEAEEGRTRNVESAESRRSEAEERSYVVEDEEDTFTI